MIPKVTRDPSIGVAEASWCLKNVVQACQYVKLDSPWLLSRPSIDKNTLACRLYREETGPTSMTLHLQLRTCLDTELFSRVIDDLDITLALPKRIRVFRKQLQSFESSSTRFFVSGFRWLMNPFDVQEIL